MALNPIVRPLGLLFSLVGFIQSLLWLIAALLSILLYFEVLEIEIRKSSYARSLLYTFYSAYFLAKDNSLLVTKQVFFGFSVAYFFLSFIWIGLSGMVFYYTRNEKWKHIKTVLIANSFVVILISVVDIILMSLLAYDYNDLVNQVDKLGIFANAFSSALTVIGILMSLAARGYVLWLLNVSSVIYTICFIVEYSDGADSGNRILYNLPIDAYREHPGNPIFAEAVNPDKMQSLWYTSSYTNEAYMQGGRTPPISNSNGMIMNQDDNTRGRPFERSQSHQQTDPSESPQWPSTPTNNRKHNNFEPATSQYAKPNKPLKPLKIPVPPVPPPKPMGKKGPPIPFPDYTPPQSPKVLRPVIKQNSSYY